MIQRVQSVYLLLSAAAIILFNYLPLGTDLDANPALTIYGKTIALIYLGSLVIAAIAVINIFLFSNRVLQMRLCRLNLALLLILTGLTGYLLAAMPERAIETPGPGLAMLVFALVFTFLSLKKIGSDEKLVRSMDRLR